VGTTTTGADISSVFPLQDWIKTLSGNIQHPFEGAPADNLPLFVIDSEGMGVRGDLYDFITTAPPAIIAKVKQLDLRHHGLLSNVCFQKNIKRLPYKTLPACSTTTPL
jgi:hypothetical protein